MRRRPRIGTVVECGPVPPEPLIGVGKGTSGGFNLGDRCVIGSAGGRKPAAYVVETVGIEEGSEAGVQPRHDGLLSYVDRLRVFISFARAYSAG
jgi:hypothetical protein